MYIYSPPLPLSPSRVIRVNQKGLKSLIYYIEIEVYFTEMGTSRHLNNPIYNNN